MQSSIPIYLQKTVVTGNSHIYNINHINSFYLFKYKHCRTRDFILIQQVVGFFRGSMCCGLSILNIVNIHMEYGTVTIYTLNPAFLRTVLLPGVLFQAFRKAVVIFLCSDWNRCQTTAQCLPTRTSSQMGVQGGESWYKSHCSGLFTDVKGEQEANSRIKGNFRYLFIS